jgi:small subunit ribosomal protein SAe
MAHVPEALNLTEEVVQLLLATNAHLGTQNVNPKMNRYIWKRRSDGVNIINIRKTWEKIVLAARVIAAIENPLDINVVSTRQSGQRAVLKFSQFIGAHPISGRFTPGGFTNQIQEKFLEPRLLIAADPRSDHQAITEASYVNVPVIAFCNSDSHVRLVDIVIPFNTSSNQAIGLGFWLLAREVLFLKGQLPRGQAWDVMVDLFIYRAPEEAAEQKKAQIENKAAAQPEETFRPLEHAQEATGENWNEWSVNGSGTTSWAETPVQQWSEASEAAPQPTEAAAWESKNTLLNPTGWTN